MIGFLIIYGNLVKLDLAIEITKQLEVSYEKPSLDKSQKLQYILIVILDKLSTYNLPRQQFEVLEVGAKAALKINHKLLLDVFTDLDRLDSEHKLSGAQWSEMARPLADILENNASDSAEEFAQKTRARNSDRYKFYYQALLKTAYYHKSHQLYRTEQIRFVNYEQSASSK